MSWDRWFFEWPAARRSAFGLGCFFGLTLVSVILTVVGVIQVSVLESNDDGSRPPVYDNGFFWCGVTLIASTLALARVLWRTRNVNWIFARVDSSVVVTAWVQVWACTIVFLYTEGTSRGVAPYLLGGFPLAGSLIGAPVTLSLGMAGASTLVTFLIDLHAVVPEVKFARYSQESLPFSPTATLVLAFGAAHIFAAVYTNRIRDAERDRERQLALFTAFLQSVADLDIDGADELLDRYLDNQHAQKAKMARQNSTPAVASAAAVTPSGDGGEGFDAPHPDDQLLAAAEDCLAALARLRPYLPLALRAAEQDEGGDFGDDGDSVEFSDPGDEGDDDDDPFSMARRQGGTGGGGGGGVVSSFDIDESGTGANTASHLRERACTVMHVECLDVLDSQSAAEAASRAAEFASVVVEQVMRNDGTVDHMTPWTITASFNGQMPCPRHAKRACSAALGVANRISSHGDGRLQVHIALDTRANLCGVCGVDRLRARVVAGDGVELAKKLPRLGRYLHATILITENVHREVSSHFDACPIDVIRASMITDDPQDIVLFELRSKRNGEEVSAFTDAFNHLREGRRVEALQMLTLYYQLTGKRDHHSTRLYCIAQAMTENESVSAQRFVRPEILWGEIDGEGDIDDYTVDETEGAAVANRAAVRERDLHRAMEHAKFENVLRDLRPETPKEVDFVDDEGEEGGLISMFCFGNNSDDGNDNTVNGSPAEQANAAVVNPEGDTRTPPRRPLPPPEEDDDDKNWVDRLPPQFSDDVLMEQWKLSKRALGTGTFSSVYLGMSLEGLLVAMKCVDLKAKQTDKNSLSGEVARMRKLQHHNVVSYISCANIGRSHFIIIMEYVSGGSLKHVLETFGPPPLPAVRKYVSDLLRGLKYLHDNGMIHCDIKPHNALLTPDGSVKLSDFGSSVNVTLYGGQNADGDDEVLVRGTSYYLAPEACRNEITSAVDIWSVGITVLELLTGKLPWEIKGSEANFIRELGKNTEMRPMIPADIPSNAAAFCKLCLNRDPTMRPTADALLRTPFLSG